MSNMYAEDGVNVSAGDKFSSIAGKMCQTTYGNNPFIEVRDLAKGNFRGPRPFKLTEGLDLMLDTAPDGVGTKVLLHDALMSYTWAAHDMLAMCIGDITRFGGMPAVFTNILNVRSLGEIDSPRFNHFVNAVEELVHMGNELGVIIHKGETAEKGVTVGTDNPAAFSPFDWEGTAIGVFREDKMIYGDRVEPGDVVIAIKEDGFRSNGISSVRKALELHYGPDYYQDPDAFRDLHAAATPSALPDRMLATAHGWYEKDLKPLIDMRLIAHITGGGFEKFAELLRPTGLSANLFGLYDLPNIMRKCADWRGMSDKDVYDTWNGGQCFLVVVPSGSDEDFVAFSQSYGFAAQVCGEITPSDTTDVEVVSKYESELLHYN